MSATHSSSLSLTGVLSETKRIINAHSRHFLALSLLFLLPISFSLILYPSLSHSSPSSTLFFFSSSPDPRTPPIFKRDLLLPTLYSILLLLLALFATASITHSTFHGFYGRPVKFVFSIKSVFLSFLPLLGTLVVTQVILGLAVFAFGGFLVLVYNGLALFGVEIEYKNVCFMVFGVLIMGLLMWLLVYLQVEWFLANVVVVVESKWGFEALRRSAYLVKGMRGVAFAMIVLFGLVIGFLAMLCSRLAPDNGGISEGWVSWAFIFQTVVYTGLMTILMLYSVASNAVLYMYCKAMRGELAFEIAEEFAREYVRLPFDDGKVPHVVYVV